MTERHRFEGRLDRDCEVCGHPDRHPSHTWERDSRANYPWRIIAEENERLRKELERESEQDLMGFTADDVRDARQLMVQSRRGYELAAELYRDAVAGALEAGLTARELADVLDVTRDAIYKAART